MLGLIIKKDDTYQNKDLTKVNRETFFLSLKLKCAFTEPAWFIHSFL